MRLLTLTLWTIIVTTTLSSQEATGLFSGTHNGLNATKINPAFSFKSENKWDFQLAGAHAFFDTNYGFIHRTSLWDLSNRYDLVEIPEAQGDIPVGQMPLPVIFKTDSLMSYFDTKSEVRGLGLLYQINNNIKVGLSINARSHASSFDIPSALNYYEVSDLRADTTYILQGFDVNAAAWTEYNAHAAFVSSAGHTIGTTIKYLRGYAGGYISNKSTFNYTNPTDNIINADVQGVVEFAYSGDEDNIGSRGNGWGIDIGYMSPAMDSRNARFGISLIDLGYINFNDPRYIVNFNGVNNIDMDAYQGITDIEEFKAQVFDDFTDIDSTDSYTMYMPTALSAQYSKPLSNNLAVEFSMTKRIKLGDQQIQRSDMVNATLMYERKHFSAFLPVTAYDYQDFRVGAAIRVLFFTIGSDHLQSLFGTSQSFDGSDLYVNVQLYPFKKSEKDHGKRIKCYY